MKGIPHKGVNLLTIRSLALMALLGLFISLPFGSVAYGNDNLPQEPHGDEGGSGGSPPGDDPPPQNDPGDGDGDGDGDIPDNRSILHLVAEYDNPIGNPAGQQNSVIRRTFHYETPFNGEMFAFYGWNPGETETIFVDFLNEEYGITWRLRFSPADGEVITEGGKYIQPVYPDNSPHGAALNAEVELPQRLGQCDVRGGEFSILKLDTDEYSTEITRLALHFQLECAGNPGMLRGYINHQFSNELRHIDLQPFEDHDGDGVFVSQEECPETAENTKFLNRNGCNVVEVCAQELRRRVCRFVDFKYNEQHNNSRRGPRDCKWKRSQDLCVSVAHN